MTLSNQFEKVAEAQYRGLFRFAMSLCRCEFEARDLTQQTFYVYATKGHQLRDHAKAKTWLFTTLHRIYLMRRRRETRVVWQPVDESTEQLPAGPTNSEFHADGAAVLDALGRLDEKHRAAVALFYLENYSYREIAAILDVPIGTVKSRLARGIAELRRRLGETPPMLNDTELQDARLAEVPV